MKKYFFFTLMISLQLFAAKKQTVSSEQWTAQYKGNGTLSLIEGYFIGRDNVYSGLNFSHYKYTYKKVDDSYFWGQQMKPAVFLIENSDEKATLKIKPKKGVKAITQFIQIVGSNSNFKTVKISVNKNIEHYVLGIEELAGILIDGNVGKFINTAPAFFNFLVFKNVDTFITPNLDFSFLILGEPDNIVSNAYVDINGDTNTIVVCKEGNLNKLIVKYGIVNSFILAGFDIINDVYTSDLPAVLAAHPPSGKIGFLKARNIAAQGEYDGNWQPTSQIISAAPISKFKVKSDQIVGDGKSLYITK